MHSKEKVDDSWDQARVPFRPHNAVGLARGRLAVGEERGVVAYRGARHQIDADGLEHVQLGRVLVECLGTAELNKNGGDKARAFDVDV